MENPVQPTPAPQESQSSWPDYVANVLYVGIILGLLKQAIHGNIAEALDGAFFATVGYFGFKGFRQGAVKELISFARFFGGLALGYFFCTDMGNALGLSGPLGSVAGFYTLFFGTFITGTLLIWLFFKPGKPPSFPSRWLGLFLGILEAVVLFALIGFAASFAPSAANGFSTALGNQLSNVVFTPMVEHSEGSPMVLLKLAQEARKGIDPQKVDREALIKELSKIRDHPKIQAVAQDPEIQQLAQQKNTGALLKHPKVIALMTDGELLKLGATLNWSEIASAVRKGITK